MNKKLIKVESAEIYVAPRDEPLKYPGPRPEGSFILADGKVHPILYDAQETGSAGSTYAGRVTIDNEGNNKSIDLFLIDQGKAPLAERFAVLGYGSDPVPGQLVSKFGRDTVIPVIFGEVDDTDIVYNLISNQGYAFAELVFGQSGVKSRIAVTFLDKDQLVEMNASEQNYKLAFSPLDVLLESGENLRGGKSDVSGLVYAGFNKIWVPEGYDHPIAIAELPAENRISKELDQRSLLRLVIEQFKLVKKGIKTEDELVQYIRQQADMEERPGKLKYELQQIVAEDPRSLEPVNSQVTILKNPSSPPKVFGNNNL